MNGHHAAEILSRLGAAGFPLRFKAKTPAIRDWERAATADPATLAASWRAGANLGIACGPSGLAVLDIDPGGAAEFERLAAGRELPPTYTVGTPRAGGRHLYFVQPPGQPVRNSAGKICPGVDVRGHGGYVAGAGSVLDQRAYDYPVQLVNGGRYVLVDDRPPAVMPGWLAELATARPAHTQCAAVRPVVCPGGYGAAALRGEAAKVSAARLGTRNGQLNESAFRLGQLVPGGILSVENIVITMMSAAADCGLVAEDGPARCERTLRGGIAAGMASPRHRAMAS